MTRNISTDTPDGPPTEIKMRTESRDIALAAAARRIAAVPVGPTLIDRLDADLWQVGEDGPIEAGRVTPAQD